ncbi:MAG: CHAP domain-containing protein [Desulfobulbaceae bacterium]|nr:CHAP domain-containing protein [Desulfobulbaceae bacterium]
MSNENQGKMMNLKKTLTVTLTTVMCLLAVITTSSNAGECGDLLSQGSWKGVDALDNSPYMGTGSSCAGIGTFGYQYQCVEYVKRFYWATGMKSTDWWGDGSDFYDNYSTYGLARYENGGQMPPKVNDLVGFDDGGYGHVAIVTDVRLVSLNNYSVDVTEQNWSADGSYSLQMSYNEVADTYTIATRGDYPIEGWLRIPYSCELYAQNPAEPITVQPGETRTFAVYFTNTMAPPNADKLRNLGVLDWKDASEGGENLSADDLLNYDASSPFFHYMELHSCDSVGNPAASWLYPGDGVWVSDDRIRIVSQNSFNTGYNQNAGFIFTGKVPEGAVPGTYNIYFRPYHATGGYLEDWGNMHFILEVVGSPVEYTVGQNAPAELFDLFVNKYAGNEAILGSPIDDVSPATSGFGTAGYYQRFENGSIQVHSGSAYIVAGDIYTEWGDLGYASWAGFPVSDSYISGSVTYQDFEAGYIHSDVISTEFTSTTHPQNLGAIVQPDNSVVLDWENRISASGVKVYRRGSPTEAIAILGPDETSFVDAEREIGHAYTYFVQALSETAESPPSNEVLINNVNSRHITGGYYHTLALKDDGSVWAWGENTVGQLGDGTTNESYTPIEVPGLLNIKNIAAGPGHNIALMNDGSVWAWGYNAFGQLGDGTTEDKYSPVKVQGLTNVIAIEAGEWHSLALKDDGTVWAWGKNNYGQLGDGTTFDRYNPVRVLGLIQVIKITAGNHSLALKNDGTVWGWGHNYDGQLGNGTISNSSTPVPVSNLSNIIAISAGEEHSLALKNDNTVWAWGNNGAGRLGDGTQINRVYPVLTSDLTNVVAIEAGQDHSLALRNDGTVWAWGDNDSGQQGNGKYGDYLDHLIPKQVASLTDIIEIAAVAEQSMALKNDGTLWIWGDNTNGQHGIGIASKRITPVQTLSLANVASIIGGEEFSLALKNDGTVWAWGKNNYGQLGDGTVVDKHSPIPITGLSNIMALATQNNHSLALQDDGTVWSWDGGGNNTPNKVSNLNNVVAISAGDVHSLALDVNHYVWAWGMNSNGQLGDGTTIPRDTPEVISGLTSIIAVTGGVYHNLALKNDGTVWSWGDNWYGQLGDGTTTDKYTPIQILELTKIIKIDAGERHSLALKNDGTVWAWGYNYFGQVGDGTNNDISVPTQVLGLTHIVDIFSGGDHNFALDEDGIFWAWGRNIYGQLGDGTMNNSNVPVQLSSLTDVDVLACGDQHSQALNNNGTVLAWGRNFWGALGNGEANSLVPVQSLMTFTPNNDRDSDGIPDLQDICPNTTLGDTVDSNGCSLSQRDVDGDGYEGSLGANTDCNDNDPNIYPGANEICDAKDNDCDQNIDEGFIIGQSCTSGLGECLSSGITVCSMDGLTVECNAIPGTPTSEICDNLDNDCDGATDEGFDLDQNCTSGLGECLASGTTVCSANGLNVECNATPGTPISEICDSLDNDCDGATDEGFDVGETCAAGIGECLSFGLTVCSANGLSSECNAIPGTPTAEICDGNDNDCDSQIDEICIVMNGDLDGDNDVDAADLSIFIHAFELDSLEADLNSDLRVDQLDIEILAQDFGR